MATELEANGSALDGALGDTPVHDGDGLDPVSQMLGNEGGDQSSTAVAEETTSTDLGGGTGAESQVTSQPQRTPWREAAVQYGHSDLGEIEDEQQLQAELFGRLNEAYQFALLGQQYASQQQLAQQHAAQQAQFQQGYQPQQFQPPGYQPAAPQLAAPQWNPYWNNFIQTGPDGKQQLKPFTPPQVVEEITRYAQQREQIEAYNAVQPHVQPLIQQQVQQGIQQYQQQVYQQNVNNDMHRFMQEQHSWMFQHDAGGGVIRTPQSPEGVLTPAGYEFFTNIQRLAQAGVGDPYVRRQLAAQLMQARLESGMQGRQAQQQQQAPNGHPQAPAARPNGPSRALRNVAQKRLGRGNSVRNSGQPGAPVQGTRRSIREMTLAQLDADGIDGEDNGFGPLGN